MKKSEIFVGPVLYYCWFETENQRYVIDTGQNILFKKSDILNDKISKSHENGDYATYVMEYEVARGTTTVEVSDFAGKSLDLVPFLKGISDDMKNGKNYDQIYYHNFISGSINWAAAKKFETFAKKVVFTDAEALEDTYETGEGAGIAVAATTLGIVAQSFFNMSYEKNIKLQDIMDKFSDSVQKGINSFGKNDVDNQFIKMDVNN